MYRCHLRQRHFLVLTVILALIFLMYQLFSVGQLGKELSKQRSHQKLQTNFKSYEKADGFMVARFSDDKKNEDIFPNEHKRKFDDNKFIPGILTSDRKFYTPSLKQTFTCLRSGEEISFSMVNDNFCDCSDFTDEPSTSACSFGRFYCSYQSKRRSNYIVSYKVNDGICDCCDGSDEWEHAMLPIHTRVPSNKQKGIYQVPCSTYCVEN